MQLVYSTAPTDWANIYKVSQIIFKKTQTDPTNLGINVSVTPGNKKVAHRTSKLEPHY